MNQILSIVIIQVKIVYIQYMALQLYIHIIAVPLPLMNNFSLNEQSRLIRTSNKCHIYYSQLQINQSL